MRYSKKKRHSPRQENFGEISEVKWRGQKTWFHGLLSHPLSYQSVQLFLQPLSHLRGNGNLVFQQILCVLADTQFPLEHKNHRIECCVLKQIANTFLSLYMGGKSVK